MGVYIPGMEMPKGCAFCKISRRNGKKMICPFIWQREWDLHDPMSADHRLDGCPLVPVPEHGDLIDRNETVKTLAHDYAYAAADMVRDEIPTIIPASKEEEERKPMTNYDRLISKIPEELAFELAVNGCPPIYPECLAKKDPEGHSNCVKCWLDWLKSPVEVDNGVH